MRTAQGYFNLAPKLKKFCISFLFKSTRIFPVSENAGSLLYKFIFKVVR